MRPEAWHSKDTGEAARLLGTDQRRGLDTGEAAVRLRRYGLNRLEEAAGKSALAMLLDQFKDFMILVLLGATLVSLALGEYVDAVVIAGIVVLNAILGLIQEMKAERSLKALKALAAPRAVVIRNGRREDIPANRVVPGDVIVIDSGTRVVADARIITASGLEAEESNLTGESLPVNKGIQAVGDEKAPVADQSSMVFASTTIVRGRGTAVVVATGMQTQVGMIAGLLTEPRTDKTPLQRRLEMLGRKLVAASVIVVGLVVAIGIWRGEALLTMFLAGVSLAVAAVPEGLPAVVTISLALGVQRMVKRNAIVRRLPAVETLGCATVICTDKTGTLTVNQMTVREMHAGGVHYQVDGKGYEPKGKIGDNQGTEVKIKEWMTNAVGRLVVGGMLCNNCELIAPSKRGANKGGWSIQGEPTEGALLALGAKAGIDRGKLEGEHPRTVEIPFESDRRIMTVVVNNGGNSIILTKGAPEAVLKTATGVMDKRGQVRVLDEKERERLERVAGEMAGRALRVLAVAGRDVRGTVKDDLEQDLVLYGLVGMIDPPRPEAAESVKKARSAGIKVVMITGDHEETAVAIAREVGIAEPGAKAVSGRDIDGMDRDELAGICEQTSVFARVSPHHKLDIVRALRRAGHIVAMTGDGVNDAPAVREADIGVAMGKTGTDVTRETSDIILADDNFATIVAAVEEGRGIYDNIRRFIRYLLSCNVGEIVVMLLASIIGWPLPLLPAQILLLNLVTDGLPATALGIERADPGVMGRRPRDPAENIFADGLIRRILSRGLLIGVVSLGAFWFGLTYMHDIALARTMAFSTLVVSQLVFAFMIRGDSERGAARLVSNPYLLAAVLSSAAVLVAVLYVPILQTAFRTSALSGVEWLVVAAAALVGALWTGLPAAARG